MKKIILALSVISILFLAGCSSNENKENNNVLEGSEDQIHNEISDDLSEIEANSIIENYLNLQGKMEGSYESFLESLELVDEVNFDENVTMQAQNGISELWKTNIQYEEFKEKLLTYMSLNRFETFTKSFEEKNGYLYTLPLGASEYTFELQEIVLKEKNDKQHAYTVKAICYEAELVKEYTIEAILIEENGNFVLDSYEYIQVQNINLNENEQNNSTSGDVGIQQNEISNNEEIISVKISKELAQRYISIINSIEKIAPNEHKYRLAYVNDDDVPELIVDKSSYYTGIITSIDDELYIIGGEESVDTNDTRIINNSIDNLDSLALLSYGTSRIDGYDYVKKGNLLSCVHPGLTSSSITIFSIDRNILKVKLCLSTQLFDGLLPLNEYDIDENVDINSFERKYYLNDNEITEEEYIEKANLLLNSERLEHDVMDAKKIIEYIRTAANIEKNQTQID